VGVLAFLFGVIAKSVSNAGVPPALRRDLARAGAGSVATPAGYLGLVFLVFVLVVSLFVASQMGALRTEELSGRLATMLALPLSRVRWLVTRLVVISGASAAISVTAAVCSWAGARAAGADVGQSDLLLAAVNGWAVASLFLGLGAVVYALAPRGAPAVLYTLVTVTFLWQLFGSVLGAPSWALDLSPFAHLGLTPARPFRPDAAAVLAVIGLAAAGSACVLLRRRDITSGT
jgi:ABC-2 type transport system permease protein